MQCNESENEYTHCENNIIKTFVQYVFLSNIMALLDAFELPEGIVTEDNYNLALDHLNASQPHVVQGLNLTTCDMQRLLSEVTMANGHQALKYQSLLR